MRVSEINSITSPASNIIVELYIEESNIELIAISEDSICGYAERNYESDPLWCVSKLEQLGEYVNHEVIRVCEEQKSKMILEEFGW